MNGFLALAIALLGCTDVQPMTRKAFLISLSQSNGVANGNTADLTDPSWATPYAPVLHAWKVANAPDDPPAFNTGVLGSLRPVQSNHFGFEMSLGHALDAAFPNNVAIYKFAVAGTSFWNNWLPGSAYPTGGPPLFSQMLTAYDAFLVAADAVHCGTFMEIGEADTRIVGAPAVYAANMQTAVEALRAHFGDTAPVVFGRLNIGYSWTAPEIAQMRAQQALFDLNVVNSTMVDQDAYPLNPVDNVHYKADELVMIGNAFAAAMIPYFTGAPAFSSISFQSDAFFNGNDTPVSPPSHAFSDRSFDSGGFDIGTDIDVPLPVDQPTAVLVDVATAIGSLVAVPTASGALQ